MLVTLTGLISGTLYDIYVVSDCSSTNNGYELIVMVSEMATACESVTTFFENFDSISSIDPPFCW